MIGCLPDGTMPDDPRAQFANAFAKVAKVLDAADLTFAAVVEMTSYHLEIQTYFDLFDEVRQTFVLPPYPAWTAVEVAGLRRPGALVEIRVIAHVPDA
jgi:enamine deaminase RidA (YjgF/YER057c/UK114 family)